jgi:hypothetical protein
MLAATVLALLLGLPGGALPPTAHERPSVATPTVVPSAVTASRAGPAVGNLTVPQWSNVTASWVTPPAGSPATYGFVDVVYDTSDHEFVGFAENSTAITPWVLSPEGWTEVNASYAPSERAYPSFVNDPALGGVIEFGGVSYANYGGSRVGHNDTWLFRAGNWTNLTQRVGTPPSGRVLVPLTFDANLSCVVAFGGATAIVGGWGLHNDTWELTSRGWSNVTPTAGVAPPFSGLGFAYDPSSGGDLMTEFSGPGYSGNYTWEFSAGRWTNLTPSLPVSPPPADWVGIATSPFGNGVLLYLGGTGAVAPTANWTWEFENDTWANLTPLQPVQPPVSSAFIFSSTFGGFAADPEGHFVLFLTDTQTGSQTIQVPSAWLLGPPAGLLGEAVPALQDVGRAIQLRVGLLTAGSNLTLSYSGLPPGCTSANVTDLICLPNAAGAFEVTATVAAGAAVLATVPIWFNVTPALAIAAFTEQPAAITLGNSTVLNLSTTGGIAPLSTHYSGLPQGCAGSSTTLRCSPSQSGTFTITATVQDSAGDQVNGSVSLTVNARPNAATVVASPDRLELGDLLRLGAHVANGTAPFAFAWSGIPPGCAPADAAELSCVPNAAGSFEVGLVITDAFGWSANASTIVSVLPDFHLAAITATPASVDLGVPVAIALETTGGYGIRSSELTGFPGTCTLDSTGQGQCLPTSPGTYTLEEKVTDLLNHTQWGNATLVVNPDPTAALVGPTVSEVGLVSAFTLEAVGGTPPWKSSFQSLPPMTALPGGCEAASPITLTCRWNSVGAFSLEAVVTDAFGSTVDAVATASVYPALRVASLTVLPTSPTAGGTFQLITNVTGGDGPFRYDYAGLPPGCPLADTAEVTCTMALAGTFTTGVTVTDSLGASAAGNVTIHVRPNAISVSWVPGAVGGGAAGAVALAAVAVLYRRRKGSDRYSVTSGADTPPGGNHPG